MNHTKILSRHVHHTKRQNHTPHHHPWSSCFLPPSRSAALQTDSKWQKPNSTTCSNLISYVLPQEAGLRHFTWYLSRHLVTGVLVVTTALSTASQFLIVIQFLTFKTFLHLFMEKHYNPFINSSNFMHSHNLTY